MFLIVITLLMLGNLVFADLNEDLNSAIHFKHIGWINEILDRGADINRAYGGVSALMKAFEKGDREIIKLILKRGANVNSLHNVDMSDLMYASFKGDFEIAKELIALGAKVNLVNSKGISALMLAIEYRRNNIADYLIKHGANINAQAKNGYTPLIFAAIDANIDMIKILISRGANVNANIERGLTALLISVVYEKFEMSKLLIKAGANVKQVTTKPLYFHFTLIPARTKLLRIAKVKRNNELIGILVNAGAGE